MTARKHNKCYSITEREARTFQQDGYDIYDDAGKLIEYGAGKKVPLEKFVELQRENEALKAEIKSLKAKKEKK